MRFSNSWLLRFSLFSATLSGFAAPTDKTIERDGISFRVYRIDKKYRGEELSLEEQVARGLRPIDSFGAPLSNVTYLSPEQRAYYRVDLNDSGLFVSLGDPALGRFLSPQRQQPLSSAMQDFAGTIVMDTEFNIYFSNFSGPGFVHSSLAGGGEVLFAGTAVLHQGRLEVLAHNSGHYKPDYFALLNFVRHLKKRGYSGDKILLRGTKNGPINSIAERYKWFDAQSIEKIRKEYAANYVSVESLMLLQPCESASSKEAVQ